MAQAGVPFLVLKGAALAHLVYGDPRLRPMRDVDLLIRKADAGRALDVLMRCGFRPGGTAVPSRHHHLQAMAKTLEGATVTIELHHELMVRTPFVEPRDYDDLIRRSQPFEWGGMSYQTLGCEDMLWHVYAHAFVINTLRPGAIRLLSVADLVHATEAWIDRIDWARLRRKYAPPAASAARASRSGAVVAARRGGAARTGEASRPPPSVPIRSIRILIGP